MEGATVRALLMVINSIYLSFMLARIYQPAKTAMQSGQAGARQWVLEFEPSAAPRADLLMGWTGTTDTKGQVRLFFASKEEALAFAQRNAVPHQLVEPPVRRRIIKSYGDNFAALRREPWSH